MTVYTNDAAVKIGDVLYTPSTGERDTITEILPIRIVPSSKATQDPVGWYEAWLNIKKLWQMLTDGCPHCCYHPFYDPNPDEEGV